MENSGEARSAVGAVYDRAQYFRLALLWMIDRARS